MTMSRQQKDLVDKKAALKDGDKDVETSMSATATADVTVSQKTTFTTTIDLSKIVVEMKKSIMITINTRRKCRDCSKGTFC